MARKICPLIEEDIPELSRFLTTGFHTSPNADYVSPDVLRWKILRRTSQAMKKTSMTVHSSHVAILHVTTMESSSGISGFAGLSSKDRHFQQTTGGYRQSTSSIGLVRPGIVQSVPA